MLCLGKKGKAFAVSVAWNKELAILQKKVKISRFVQIFVLIPRKNFIEKEIY